MDCIDTTIRDIDEMFRMADRCFEQVGGPGWGQLAIWGLAVVIGAIAFGAIVFWVVMEVRG